MVSHSGEVAAGEWIHTLCATDLSTGWTERVPVMGKGEHGIVVAIERIREQLPFPLLGLHPDSGSEFLNWHLFGYCQTRGIAFSRSRPDHKNDNAHVEQKNWTLPDRVSAPRHAGPAGLAGPPVPRPAPPQPVMKLIRKETVGQRTRKVYDRPTTPLQRLLNAGAADADKITALVGLYTGVSPLTLKRQIDRRLAAMPAALEVTRSA